MPASLYLPLYLIIVTLFTIVVINKYPSSTLRYKFRDISFQTQAVFLTLFLIVFIGFRPLSSKYFVDMVNYDLYYKVFAYKANNFTFNWDVGNYIYENLFNWMGFMGFEVDYFFLVMAFIYFSCLLWACIKIFPRDTLLAFPLSRCCHLL